MKIGLDLRFLKKWDYYSDFVLQLVQNLIKTEINNDYYLFININFSSFDFWKNSQKVVVNTWNIYEEQIKFKKILDKYKLGKTIFFTYNKPLKYKCNYIIFIPDLEEFHFSPKKNIFKKYFDNYLLTQNSKNASKIICFNEKIKEEINDKLNIFEDNIEIITPFFTKKQTIEANFNLDIRLKYSITQNYLIYYFWNNESKNFDRIIEIFERYKQNNINLSLAVLDNHTTWDINLRKKVIAKNLTDKIFFIWKVSQTEESLFFKESSWVLYPVLYSIFPFELSTAMSYNNKIISSNLKNIKNIFNNQINYFNQTSIEDMYKSILNASKKSKFINYDNIFNKYSIDKTTSMLINILK